MPSDGRLLPEDLARELDAPAEWIEQARHLLPLPHHVQVSDMSWFVLPDDLHIWERRGRT
jgi:hypothetical protein